MNDTVDYVNGLKSLSGLRVLTAEQSDFLFDAADEIERLRNVAQSAWQPIKTAPRDGREILLWLGEPWSKPEKAKWYEPWSNWICGAIPQDPAREEYHGIGSSLPTHWMLVPAGPALSSAHRKESSNG